MASLGVLDKCANKKRFVVSVCDTYQELRTKVIFFFIFSDILTALVTHLRFDDFCVDDSNIKKDYFSMCVGYKVKSSCLGWGFLCFVQV